MTIRGIAASAGVSVTAVYKRIKKAGIQLETLKNKETGELTPDGERTILDMFNLHVCADSGKDGSKPV